MEIGKIKSPDYHSSQIILNAEDDMIFQNESGELLKLCSNGDIYVKNKLIENDKDIIIVMRQFLGIKA